MIKNLITISLVLLAVCAFNLGMDWINFSHGLNPWAAFPLTILLCVFAVVTYTSWDIITEVVDGRNEVDTGADN